MRVRQIVSLSRASSPALHFTALHQLLSGCILPVNLRACETPEVRPQVCRRFKRMQSRRWHQAVSILLHQSLLHIFQAAAALSSAHTLPMYIPLGPFPDNTTWPFGSIRVSYLLNSIVRAPALSAFLPHAAAAEPVKHRPLSCFRARLLTTCEIPEAVYFALCWYLLFD